MPGPSEDATTQIRLERETLHEISAVKSDVAVLKSEMSQLRIMTATLISRAEFKPVQLIAYGLATSVCAAVLAAILSLVVRRI
jgi:hypothetical protein